MAADVCERRVVGADPFHIEQLWRRVYADGYTMRPDVSMMGILSAVEMACWDIIGKEANKPVYELLGGQVRDSLRTYTYLYPDDDTLLGRLPLTKHTYIEKGDKQIIFLNLFCPDRWARHHPCASKD